jgi:hypothetical protein
VIKWCGFRSFGEIRENSKTALNSYFEKQNNSLRNLKGSNPMKKMIAVCFMFLFLLSVVAGCPKNPAGETTGETTTNSTQNSSDKSSNNATETADFSEYDSPSSTTTFDDSVEE